MMLSGLWMTADQQLHILTYEHMNQCNAAMTVGVIWSLSPAHEKELYRDTVVTDKDYNYRVHACIY